MPILRSTRLVFLLLLAGAVLPAAASTLTLMRGGAGTGTVGTLTEDGVFCGQGCTSAMGFFPAGTPVVLVARPSPGSDFEGWDGACSGMSTGMACELTLSVDAWVRARFKLSADLPSCGTASVFWTRSPVDVGTLVAVVPLGNLNPLSGHVFPTRHGYFDSRAPAAVSAPGNAVLTGGRASKAFNPATGWTGWDFEIDLSPCREARTILLHIQEDPPGSLHALLGAADWCDAAGQTCLWSNRRVGVTAGQPLGRTGLVERPELDFEAYDMRSPGLTWADPGRGLPEWLHLTCPLDAFSDVASPDPNASFLRSTLSRLLGSFDGTRRRTAPPVCGTAAQDLPGKAQGNWYLAGWPPGFSEDAHLALVHDNVDPSLPAISLNISLDSVSPRVPPLPPDSRLPGGVYTYQVYPFAGRVNKDFAAVDPTERRVWCFEKLANAGGGPPLNQTVLLVQMPTAFDLYLKRVSAWGCEAIRGSAWSDGPYPATPAGAVHFVR
jgi:hypothetical protein